MDSDLASWFHLLTQPSDYTDEAEFATRVVHDVGDGDSRTLLELGSGGGNNASQRPGGEPRLSTTVTLSGCLSVRARASSVRRTSSGGLTDVRKELYSP